MTILMFEFSVRMLLTKGNLGNDLLVLLFDYSSVHRMCPGGLHALYFFTLFLRYREVIVITMFLSEST